MKKSSPRHAPHDPFLLYPHHAGVVDGSHVLLRWEPALEAEIYAIEIADDPEFHNVVFTTEVPAALTEFVVPVPFPDDARTLYWRVSAANADGWSEGAHIESFTSGTAGQVGRFPEPDEAEPFGPLASLVWSFRRRRRAQGATPIPGSSPARLPPIEGRQETPPRRAR